MESDEAFATVITVGPATLYGELVHCRGSALGSWIEDRFEVVARPGEKASSPPAAGDLVITIPVGQRGSGSVTMLGPGDEGRFGPGGRSPAGTLVLRPRRDAPRADGAGFDALQSEDLAIDPATADEAATDLGRDLASRFASGVRVAIYDPDEPEFARRADEWARREEAVGASAMPITAATLAVGVAMPDSRGLVRVLAELGQALAKATATTGGPALIRTLALFAHGWGTTFAIGNGLTKGNVADVVRRLAPTLAKDVTVVLFGCTVAAQDGEGGWFATTMHGGGAASLAAMVRDELVANGKTSASVWGHTEVGHTTRNWSLRRFRASTALPGGGKGAAGEAFAGDVVFGAEKARVLAQIETELTSAGHRVAASKRPEFERYVLAQLDHHLYRAYGAANRALTHGGANLAERAPTHPDEVAEVIRTYWRDVYWVAAQVQPFVRNVVATLRPIGVLEPVGGAARTTAKDNEELEGYDAEAGPSPCTPVRAKLSQLVLAGPIVRRAEPESVWFWFASSEEITSCTPSITVYDSVGNVQTDLTRRLELAPAKPRVAKLGDHLWVVLVEARPKSHWFAPGWTYGYDLTITPSGGTPKRLVDVVDGLAYRPFTRPTFTLALSGTDRIVHGSCRRPGAHGPDVYTPFDQWLAREIGMGPKGNRPPSLILTGDQIYADDVAYPLFQGVQRLANDVFGYAEELPARTGPGTFPLSNLPVPDWRIPTTGIPTGRAMLTRRAPGKPDRPGPIGFSTEDGEGHLLSFAEFAAMYLLVSNPDLWRRYVPDVPHLTDSGTNNLMGFATSVAASRRVLANTVTYMLFDDHEITDDWNLDGDWAKATQNPTARRVIGNGLAAYWAFQGWGNEPGAFDQTFIDTITRHLDELSRQRGKPGSSAVAFDSTLHARHWSYIAPTRPQALCVDTRTRREFVSGKASVLSGPKVWRELAPLLAKKPFKRREPMLIVLPTPLLPHRSMLRGQEHRYKLPKDRYQGDFESYGNLPEQRPDLIAFLRSVADPPAVIVFSGDVHHGSVVDGMYVGGASLDDINRGRGAWAVRVAQVTSSAIKNLNRNFTDKLWWTGFQTDAGLIGQTLVPQYENQYKTMPDGTKMSLRADVARLSGALGRKTYVYENHLCVVDLGSSEIGVLYVGAKDGKVATATTRVSLTNDPKTFRPSDRFILQQKRFYGAPVGVM